MSTSQRKARNRAYVDTLGLEDDRAERPGGETGAEGPVATKYRSGLGGCTLYTDSVKVVPAYRLERPLRPEVAQGRLDAGGGRRVDGCEGLRVGYGEYL
jgi:hypothetical protein